MSRTNTLIKYFILGIIMTIAPTLSSFSQGPAPICPPENSKTVHKDGIDYIGCGSDSVVLKIENPKRSFYTWYAGSSPFYDKTRNTKAELVLYERDFIGKSGEIFRAVFTDDVDCSSNAVPVRYIGDYDLGVCNISNTISCTVFCGTKSGILRATAGFDYYKWYRICGENGTNKILVKEGTSNELYIQQDPNCIQQRYGVEANVNGCTKVVGYIPKFADIPNVSFTLNSNVIQKNTAIKLTPGNITQGHLYQLFWGDGQSQTIASTAEISHVYTTIGSYKIELVARGDCPRSISRQIRVGSLCESSMPPISTGEFKMNKRSGEIVFVKTGCPNTVPFSCLMKQGTAKVIPNVVSSSAITLSDKWEYEDSDYYKNTNGSHPSEKKFRTNANDFEKGKMGKWRLESSFSYQSPINNNGLNFTRGTYDMDLFYWKYEKANNPNKWLKATTVEKYSPHGDALQERNILGISSVAKFGYRDDLPYLTAQNAEYEAVFFESFENRYSTSSPFILEDGFSVDKGVIDSKGHSGSASFKPNEVAGLRKVQLPSFNASYFYSKNMLLKFWIRTVNQEERRNIKSLVKVNALEDAALKNLDIVAQVGEWSLCTVLIDFKSLTHLQKFTPVIVYSGGEIWVDDIRVQPSDSQMTTYVYDPKNLRLLTVLDDQNFGLFYQYNAEGKLIRKQIETEKGVKTVQETHYNITKE